MTLDQLCLNDDTIGKQQVADYLESLTDVQLEVHFAPLLNVTRPDRETAIHKEKVTNITGKRMPKMSEAEQMLLSMAPEKRALLEKLSKEQGLDLDDLI